MFSVTLNKVFPARGPVEGFVRSSLGFRCISSPHTDNLSFIGTKLDDEITLTEWLKMRNNRYHCS